MKKEFLEAGKIVGTHGLKGELRVQSWCRSMREFCGIRRFFPDSGGTKPIRVVAARVHKNIIILKLEGITTVEQADVLRDTVLYIARSDVSLADGEHFIQDLIGIRAVDHDTGFVYGTVTDVFNSGASDIYEITSSAQKKYLVPVVDGIVIDIVPEEGYVSLRPIKGLFEDADTGEGPDED